MTGDPVSAEPIADLQRALEVDLATDPQATERRPRERLGTGRGP